MSRTHWPSSSTDPISVMAIFKRLGAGRRLSLMIEAESLFNNDTAVVLFTIVMGALAGGAVSVTQGITQFLLLFIGGAVVGGMVGLFASRLHRELDDHLVEITLTSIVAYGAYLTAEALHVSGVMAVIVAGMVIGNVGMPLTMSPRTRLAVAAFWEYAAFVVNGIVFLLIGIEVGYVNWTHRIGITLLAIGIVLVGRAGIYPLSLLVNRLKGDVPLAWQHILFWGGLRGALSMALALGLDPTFPQRDTLIAVTFGVVLFSLLVQGMTLGPLLTRLKLCGEAPQDPHNQKRLASEIMACEAALAELDRFRHNEAHPNWSIELLRREYQARLASLEAVMTMLRPDHVQFREEQVVRARRLALVAEKSALTEAQRHGWLEEADRQQLTATIDAQLVALSHTDPLS